MIIFGTKGYVHQMAMLMLLCGQCGNPAAHALRKRVTKFTLFFVPLFTVSSKYATQCTFCGAERRVEREEAERLQAQAAQGDPGAQGPGPHGGQQTYGQGPGGATRQQNPYQ
ncbi:zinc-ribbon domain-containing protein [Streptomyces sp. CA-294286]|uniref:zinc-ribbon domain-containing protein n=1 Tax=Streptomyces sp. CA-294286 TaxID=3240070 RepID=UPI003D8C59F6